MLFTGIFSLVLLIACWWIADAGLLTKVVLTLLFLGSFGLFFVNPAFIIVAHCILIVITGTITFGPEFLNRRM